MVNGALHGEGTTKVPFTVWYLKAPASIVECVGVPKGFGNIAGKRPIKGVHTKNKNYDLFYNTLEESIEKDGFRNPILCWRTSSLYCIYGTSRLYIGARLQRNIPMFVVDFSERWTDGEKVESEKQALSKFTDPPEKLVFNTETFNFYNKWWDYDPQYRKKMGLPQGRLSAHETN